MRLYRTNLDSENGSSQIIGAEYGGGGGFEVSWLTSSKSFFIFTRMAMMFK